MHLKQNLMKKMQSDKNVGVTSLTHLYLSQSVQQVKINLYWFSHWRVKSNNWLMLDII